MGKSWFLRIEARRLALEALKQLDKRTATVNEIRVPILARLQDLAGSTTLIATALISEAATGRSAEFRLWLETQLKAGLEKYREV